MAPSSDTEVTLPEFSDTDWVLASGRLRNSVFVAWSLALPTPSTIDPEGARIVPDCTILVASTSSAPPADSGTCDGPLLLKVMVVGGCGVPVTSGPAATMAKVSPLAG